MKLSASLFRPIRLIAINRLLLTPAICILFTLFFPKNAVAKMPVCQTGAGLTHLRFANPFGNDLKLDSLQFGSLLQSRVFVNASLHLGQDIYAPSGTKVFASKTGVPQIYRGQLDGWTNGVILDHGLGLKTVYMHLNAKTIPHEVQSAARAGQPIVTGTYLGKLVSYKMEKAHLHFAIIDLEKGIYYNPLCFFDYKDTIAPKIGAIFFRPATEIFVTEAQLDLQVISGSVFASAAVFDLIDNQTQRWWQPHRLDIYINNTKTKERIFSRTIDFDVLPIQPYLKKK